jgi:hypothetical protein
MGSGFGFNTMKVYVDHLLWTSDKEGFKKRLNGYLTIANKHGIKTIFVFLMIVGMMNMLPANNLYQKLESTKSVGFVKN